MPRTRDRFAALEAEFRRSGGESGDDSRLQGYIDWKKGKHKVTVERRPSAAEMKRVGYALIPFRMPVGSTVENTVKLVGTITNYSNNGRRDLSLSDNDLGYRDLDDADRSFEGYYPALLRIFTYVPGTTKTNVPRSGITLKPYKRLIGKTYGVPFGRSLSVLSDTDEKTGSTTTNTTIQDVGEEEARVALIDKITDFTATNNTINVGTISYEPEVFRKSRPKPVAPSVLYASTPPNIVLPS